MSVVQHIRDRAGRFRWMGLLVVWAVFIVMAAVLLVEQNAQAALSVADRGYVLETGKIVTTGTGAELLASPAIKKAYLGG